MIPDVSHVCTFRCVVHVVLPPEKLGKLDDRAAMGYTLRYKYNGAYWVWILKMGVKEIRDVTFYKGEALILPDIVEESNEATCAFATLIWFFSSDIGALSSILMANVLLSLPSLVCSELLPGCEMLGAFTTRLIICQSTFLLQSAH